FTAPLIRLVKPPAGHAVTGQFIIAGSLSAGACHAERYPRWASWRQLNHIKYSKKDESYIQKMDGFFEYMIILVYNYFDSCWLANIPQG
uniref:hypothetical protein n=2 Tax=Leuconostoc TaxID=1243 RepID=UPI00345E1D56